MQSGNAITTDRYGGVGRVVSDGVAGTDVPGCGQAGSTLVASYPGLLGSGQLVVGAGWFNEVPVVESGVVVPGVVPVVVSGVVPGVVGAVVAPGVVVSGAV
jgi:hypothetical protein